MPRWVCPFLFQPVGTTIFEKNKRSGRHEQPFLRKTTRPRGWVMMIIKDCLQTMLLAAGATL